MASLPGDIEICIDFCTTDSEAVNNLPDPISKKFYSTEFVAAAEYYVSATRYYAGAKKFARRFESVTIDIYFRRRDGFGTSTEELGRVTFQ
jgi:hypothetical protein